MTDALIIQDNFAHAPSSRGPHAARVFKNRSLRIERAQGMPGVFRTRSLVCENKKHTSKSTTGTPNIPACPARWFYDVLRALPGDRAFLSPSPRNAKHCRELISASRYQDHTASSSAKRALVRRARRVHRTPRQRSVTIAKRPSSRARDARKMLLICPTAQVKGLRHFNATGKSLG
jgi:hypothetical protein